MKNLINISAILLLSILFVSCKDKDKEPEKIFDKDFDNITIFYYGHSFSGLTYEIPIKFYFNNKEMAFFYLFSFDPYLETGIYNYTDSVVGTWRIFPPSRYSDKTFFKNRCKWGDSYITGGTIIVNRNIEDDYYMFVVEVTDEKGEQHYGKYNGKITREDWYEKSETGGIFSVATFWEDWEQPSDENYSATMLQLNGGDIYNYLEVSLGFLRHANNTNVEGIYHINPSANGYIRSAVNGVYSNFYTYKDYPVDRNSDYSVRKSLQSGTITITRINKPCKYRIDVDVVAENGYTIKECFDGGNMDLWGNMISW